MRFAGLVFEVSSRTYKKENSLDISVRRAFTALQVGGRRTASASQAFIILYTSMQEHAYIDYAIQKPRRAKVLAASQKEHSHSQTNYHAHAY